MKHIAFIANNREVSSQNVKKHAESLKKFGRNLVPLLYVEATEVGDYQLYDADNGKLVDKAEYPDYWVVLDGQHRYKAARRLEKKEEFDMNNLKWQEVELGDNSFIDVLTEVNTVSYKWKGGDFIHGLILQDPENELYKFAYDLIQQGVSGKTVGKYLTFRDNVKWADPKTYKDANLPRAKKIWAVAKTFGTKTAKESIIIDYIIEKGSWEADLPKIAALTEKQKDILENVNKNDRKDTFLDMIGQYLTRGVP